jgi:transcription-repair coupling factor (superfamily II helicase)
MPSLNPFNREILVCSVTPYFLEQGEFWFEENWEKIKSQAKTNAWWERNTLFLEKGQKINPSQVIKKLVDFGYEKVQEVSSPAEFSVRGGIIEIFPINPALLTKKINPPIKSLIKKDEVNSRRHSFILEFAGNYIQEIFLKERESIKKLKKYIKKLEFQEGDYVVHLDHGIGIFRGFKEENNNRYYILEYAPPLRPGAPPDCLLVPESQSQKISLYVGFGTPKIHRLGGVIWQKTKKAIKEETEKLARELLELYANREAAWRPPYKTDEDLEKELESSFPFLETPDQKRAIREVKKDMESDRPMDRIVCGDVGFGKTEVAVRAALAAAACGKQTALLVPTTILCEQHFETFTERLKNFPVSVSMLSRLTPAKKEREILDNLKNGRCDIIIGTHRLLSSDVEIKNLGLLIIDEEQRFGVRQKEKFKKINPAVDVLYLSATPIPRTLHLALSGLRRISIINTPPPERLPVKTFILPFSKKIVREAIEAELSRNGQVYYLHNRVETLEAAKRNLAKLTPRAKLASIHGRMNEADLVKIMRQFRRKETDTLVATTIIENGLDNPSVNTLIVANASRLGLAQAYQIRGRVGRSHIQSYAYFLYQRKNLAGKAKERLEALKRAEALGSGYQIALRDLEIRGAGNILGKEQSGNINQVGLNLYCHMLSEAIEKIKSSQNI